jgi:hypothetical protein
MLLGDSWKKTTGKRIAKTSRITFVWSMWSKKKISLENKSFSITHTSHLLHL